MLLHYVVSGKGKFIVGDKEYWLERGQIFVIHPFEMTYKETYLCGKIWELIALLFAEKAEGKEKKSLNATDLVNMAKTYMET